MTDVTLQQEDDGGEIYIDGAGGVETTDDLSTTVYISLLGGGNWWADASLNNADEKLTGQTGMLLDELPPTPANLVRIEQAAIDDLQWLKNIGAASTIAVSTSLSNINRLTIDVNIEYDGLNVDLTYSLNWTM